jgi:hypothetical protein
MMVPAWEAPAFEVVEPKLALQVLVDTLGSPSLHDDAYELPLADVLGQGGEEVVGGLGLTVAPLDEGPLDVRFGVDAGRRDSPEREACGEVLLGALAPGAAAEAVPGFNSQREVADVHRVASEAGLRIGNQDEGLRNDADGILETQVTKLVTEVARRAVGRIREDDASWQPICEGSPDHGDPKLWLGLELDRIGDACLLPPCRNLGPALGQVEFEVDGYVLGGRGEAVEATRRSLGSSKVTEYLRHSGFHGDPTRHPERSFVWAPLLSPESRKAPARPGPIANSASSAIPRRAIHRPCDLSISIRT